MPNKPAAWSQVIQSFQKVHNLTYSYLPDTYKNKNTKMVMVCKKHGEFEQTPSNHLSGKGCRKCGYAKVSKANTKVSQEEFLRRAKATHGDTYDYTKSQYVTSKTKLIITCSIHGDFKQHPYNHVTGQGCPSCKGNKITNSKLANTQSFIAKAKAIHGSTYGYHKVNYLRSKEKVAIVCKTHGVFYQAPTDHLSGKGCSACNRCGFDRTRPAILYVLLVANCVYKVGVTNKTIKERFNRHPDRDIIIPLLILPYATGQEAERVESDIKTRLHKHRYTGKPLLSIGNTELFTVNPCKLGHDYA